MRSLLILIFMVFCISTVTDAAGSSFTQSDRDRMIRLEEGLKATNQRMEDGFKATNQRIDDLKADMNRRLEHITTFMFWGFGILFGLFFSGMGFLIGFVLWDRRIALTPAVRKTKELEEQAELLKKALQEVALNDPHVHEALKHVGML
ncbi:MAG: hypothetical protein HQK89_06010 [Nitrospirae bacterium]|nr:hypothetical protein [Nitrospirota bacterium]